jgi:hypothetical protein
MDNTLEPLRLKLMELLSKPAGKIAAGLVIVLIVLAASRGPEEPPPPIPSDPTKLVASPDEPLMAEAIRIAQNTRADGDYGPWQSRKPVVGPVVSIKTVGGTITLTHKEIADANEIFGALKEDPIRLHYNSQSRSSTSFDDAPGEWGEGSQ